MDTIGKRIKNLRCNKMHMSQVAFADEINVSKQTLYKYENDIVTNIPSDKIEDIAKFCGVSPSYLMGWEDTLSLPEGAHPLHTRTNGKRPSGRLCELWHAAIRRGQHRRLYPHPRI